MNTYCQSVSISVFHGSLTALHQVTTKTVGNLTESMSIKAISKQKDKNINAYSVLTLNCSYALVVPIAGFGPKVGEVSCRKDLIQFSAEGLKNAADFS